MNIYQKWGFVDSPFQVTPLPPSELGEKLLIGREKELASLSKKLFNPPKIATIEGLNGVGKTSLVNVAAFKAFRDCYSGWNGPLLIPCNKVFQLDASKDADKFIDEVLMAVAQTLIDRAKGIQALGVSIKTGPIDKWLNSPQAMVPIWGEVQKQILHPALNEVVFAKKLSSGCSSCFLLRVMAELSA